MDESTISESAESEIRKKKIKAADPLAGQADVLLARHGILLPHQERVTNLDEPSTLPLTGPRGRLGLAALQAGCQR